MCIYYIYYITPKCVYIIIYLGAAHHNYYMWYGGNHQSWTAGSGITSMYADGVNLHYDGLDHEPKKTHLKRLHNILAMYGEYPMMESSIGIGNEIPLNSGGSNSTFSLKVQNCDISNQNQQWIYDSNTGLLKLSAYNNAHCVISTGNSDPVMTTDCDTNNKHEKWTYDNTGLQFKSSDNSCLDIFGENNDANIDEWQCKNPSSSDAKNQQWIIDSNTKQIKSKLNGQCLTASASQAFAYQYGNGKKWKIMEIILIIIAIGI